MSREQLKIEFRKHQIIGALDPSDSLSDFGNVVVVCNPDGTATYTPGDVDQAWTDVTDLTTGLDKFDLTWDASNTDTSDGTTEINEAGSNYDKGVSAELTFNDAAFQYIYDFLLADPCGLLNAIDVRITDRLCGRNYRIFELKADNVTYRPFDEPCELTVALRESDPIWHCVHKTFIWDNWQEWFQDGSAKEHPCFLTAVEPRPRLIASARMGLSIFGQTIPIVSSIFSENDNVFRRILNVDNFVDSPLVRDIIINACGKCGLTYDTIFTDPASPYYNVCLYNPCAGVWHQDDSDGINSPALWFHFDNRWDVTIAEFLDKLKKVYKAEWYVTPNSQLVFKNKTAFLNTPAILDFSQGSALPVYELEYSFGGTKKPAYGKYQYTIDASDLATQEILPLYNEVVDYDGPANNQMLEGAYVDTLEFAATGFVRDGKARGDYMRDLINDGETVGYALVIVLAVIIASLLAGVLSAAAAAALGGFLALWVIQIGSKASDLRNTFGSATYTGAVRITADQVGTPRLLLWDGASLTRAKVVKQTPASIAVNAYYNPGAVSWEDHNTFQYVPVGGLFVFNYPMYFDSFFTGNLYDRFHDAVDNPLKSLDTNQSFTFYTDLCCDVQTTLGVWEDAFIRIGYFVLLEHRAGYDVFGRIEHVELTYDDSRLRLKGTVYYKKT